MAMPLLTAPSPTACYPRRSLHRPAPPPLRTPLRFASQPRRSIRPVSATPQASPGSTSEIASEGVTAPLERVEVFDLTGKAVPIVDLWRERKAVVAFARHFGCVLCRKRADLLASKKEIMDAAGVALVLIGPGSVEQAMTFSEQTKFQGEIYADPTQSSYDALNFVYGVSTTFTPSAGLKIIQSYLEGYRQDWELSFQSDTVSKGGWQQGGLLVAGPGVRNISYIHKESMDVAGVALVLIGPGSVDQAKTFSEQTKFQGEIYADPTHSSYDALNFVYGVSTTFTPSAGLKIIQSYLEGYRQDWELSFKSDTVSKGGWQQGGLLVAGPGVRNISYIHKDKEAGDDPDIEDVLKACCQ